jgi:hypothetical protein
MIEARRANSTMNTSIQASSFTLRLVEGEYQIGLRGLPLGYLLKGISVGDTPLTGSLKIAPGIPAPASIVITLASIPLESIQGVKVSGRITGVQPGSLAGTSVILTGGDPGTPTIETTPNPDGTFEFPKVPSGNYNARLNGIANASVSPLATRFFVGTDNITGLQIPVEVRTVVTGRVTVVDANSCAILACSSRSVCPSAFAPTAAAAERSSFARTKRVPQYFLGEGQEHPHFRPGSRTAGYAVKSAVSGS